MELTKGFVNSCNRPSMLREFLLQAMDQIDAMEEERRWRKMPRGEVYSTQFTERGWKSFSDLHKL